MGGISIWDLDGTLKTPSIPLSPLLKIPYVSLYSMNAIDIDVAFTKSISKFHALVHK
jgi:hypothetical protein